MAMSRSFGGTWLTTRLLIRISPPEMFSSPAIIRRSVDFPQPDGPTRMTNSPSSMSIDTPWMTGVAPKLLVTSLISTDAIRVEPRSVRAARDGVAASLEDRGAAAGRRADRSARPEARLPPLAADRARARLPPSSLAAIIGVRPREIKRSAASASDHEPVREDIQP
jgi:hypothetical protein